MSSAKRTLVVLASFFLFSCATYYVVHSGFNDLFEAGDYRAAVGKLEEKKRRERKKDRFVFFLDKGITHHLLGEWSVSNAYLERAYLFGEDHAKDILRVAVRTLSPKLSLYLGEDFEHIIPLYYKALNYVFLGELESALVECRRIDVRTELLSQKYPSEGRFRRDAFVHVLMGVIYEASGSVNDAFIAYRNAYTIYRDDYKKLFAMTMPQQLVRDVARTAYLSGFMDEYRRVVEDPSNEWGGVDARYHSEETRGKGHVVVFWNNGVGPYKREAGFTFVKVDGVGGAFSFTTPDGSVIIPFASDDGRGNFSGFNSMRTVFPKYVERPLYYESGSVWVDEVAHDFELVEDVNAIAFQTLKQRMVKEISQAIVRTALKEVVKGGAKRVHGDLGLLTDLAFFFTEHADTRGWQTSPHSIYYTRFLLPEGTHRVAIDLTGHLATQKKDTLLVQAVAGDTRVYAYNTMQASFSDGPQ